MLSDMILDNHTIKNPFQMIFYLENKNQEYDIEWLLKNMRTHYSKLFITVENILEAQSYISNKDNNKLNIFNAFSLSTFLEYFYIKKSTIIDLLDILYIKYFGIRIKNKKEIESILQKDFSLYFKEGTDKYAFFRNHFKENILEVRNRIIHDQGYSTRVFKMDDNILTFEIANSENNTILSNINSVFSYYDKPDLILSETNINVSFLHTPLLILTNYVTFHLYVLFEYIQIIINLIIQKSNVSLELKKWEEQLFKSTEYSHSDMSLSKLKEKLNEIEKLITDDNYWEISFK